jgi:hypothetical protein
LIDSPPRAVSFYLIFISAPVCITVLITLSSLTVHQPSSWRARHAAVMALTGSAGVLRGVTGTVPVWLADGQKDQPCRLIPGRAWKGTLSLLLGLF